MQHPAKNRSGSPSATGRRSSSLCALAQWAGAALVLAGLLVLAGWVFAIPLLKDALPHLEPAEAIAGAALGGLLWWGAWRLQREEAERWAVENAFQQSEGQRRATTEQAAMGVWRELALQRLHNQILLMEKEADWEGVVLCFGKELRPLVEYYQCSINLVDLEKKTCQNYGLSAAGEPELGVLDQLPLSLERALQTGVPAYRRNPAEMAAQGDQLPPEVRSVVDVPFAGGTVALSSRVEEAFGEGDIQLLEQFAQVISSACRRLEDLQALAFSERQFQELFESAPDAMVMVDREGRITLGNTQAEKMFGYRREELLGQLVEILIPPRYRAQHREHRNGYAVAPQVRSMGTSLELFAQCRDGREFPVEISLSPLMAGEQMVVCSAIRDISVRHRRETEEKTLSRVREQVWKMHKPEDIAQVLEEVKKSLQAVGVPFQVGGINVVEGRDSSKFHSYEMNADGDWYPSEVEEVPCLVQFWRGGVPVYRRDLYQEDAYGERESLEKGFGHPVRAVLDMPFTHGTLAVNSAEPDAFSEADIAFMQRLVEVLSEGFQRLDDLRALAEKDHQLRQAQKLEALGQLAGGVAHDFNNLITIIEGYSRLLLKTLPEGDVRRASAEEIQRAGERAEGLVRQLLAFSRRQSVNPMVLDLNQVVAGVEKMLRRLIREDIQLTTVLAPGLGRIKADAGQVEQVLMNMVVNARDAMPEGGKLQLQTASVELGAPQAKEVGLERAGAYVCLEVRDTGVGMSAEVQARIFEPFFTTKVPGQGTGLGLATVYGIVKQHQGAVQVRSQLGEGATFRVYLPCIEGEAAGPAARSQLSPEGFRGRETILVVEDEPALRRVVALILQELGYTVLSAESGVQALSLSGQCQEDIDLVLTDMVMPGMRGGEVVERLRLLRPGIKAVYMSGYTEQVQEVEGQVRLLQKPFTPESLARAVRQVLETV